MHNAAYIIIHKFKGSMEGSQNECHQQPRANFDNIIYRNFHLMYGFFHFHEPISSTNYVKISVNNVNGPQVVKI